MTHFMIKLKRFSKIYSKMFLRNSNSEFTKLSGVLNNKKS